MKKTEMYTLGRACVIKPFGEMTFFFLEELNQYIKDQIQKNQFRYIYDMTEVSWIDSIGLGLIASSVKFAKLNGVKVAVVKPRENIVELLKMSALIDFIVIYDNLDRAVEQFL